MTKYIIFDLDGTLTDQSRIFKMQAEAVAGAFGAGPHYPSLRGVEWSGATKRSSTFPTRHCEKRPEEATKQSRENTDLDHADTNRHQAIIDAFYTAHDDAVANHPEHRGDLPWYLKHMGHTFGVTLTDQTAAELATAWKAAHEHAMATQALYPDVVENLTQLKAAGCTLYLASGNTKENRQTILKNLNLDHFFTDIFAAGTIGHQKQRREFWEVVLHTIGVPAASLTVVGNQLNDDIIHPQALGMQTILIERPAGLARSEAPTTVTPDHKIATLRELQYE